MKKGDSFYIEVMGKKLGYKVDRITVIKPDDSSKLRMTCTPYGVNSHRLLVSGVRAEIPEEVPDPDDVHGVNTTWLALGAIVLLAVLLAFIVILMRRKQKRDREFAGLAQHAARPTK